MRTIFKIETTYKTTRPDFLLMCAHPDPTSDGGPVEFAQRLAKFPGWKGSGDLVFLNGWTYKLGAEILTPFGREQLFQLGVGFRIKCAESHLHIFQLS